MTSGSGSGQASVRSPRRLFRSAAVLGVVALLLSGCSLIFGPDTSAPGYYAKVDAVVEELDLHSVGEVVYEGHSGTGGFSAGARTAQVIVEGARSSEVIQQRLEDIGFTSLNGHSWERGMEEKMIAVYLDTIEAGATVTTQDDAKTRVTEAAVLVSVSDL